MFECPNSGSICNGTCDDCPNRLRRPSTKEEILASLTKTAESMGIQLPINVDQVVDEMYEIGLALRRDADALFPLTATRNTDPGVPET